MLVFFHRFFFLLLLLELALLCSPVMTVPWLEILWALSWTLKVKNSLHSLSKQYTKVSGCKKVCLENQNSWLFGQVLGYFMSELAHQKFYLPNLFFKLLPKKVKPNPKPIESESKSTDIEHLDMGHFLVKCWLGQVRLSKY